MSIDVKYLVCERCGSTDIALLSLSEGICHSCGTRFVIRTAETSSSEASGASSSEENPQDPLQILQQTSQKFEIRPEYSKEDFLRSVYIAAAAEDAPLSLFHEHFDDVSVIEHQILIASTEAFVDYQSSIGYDRQEPYIAYESYYEKEPYIDYEKHYNSDTKQTEERQVTKYKEVRKERPVTRYRTVTDWSSISARPRVHPTNLAEMVPGLTLDKAAFTDALDLVKVTSICPASSELSRRMVPPASLCRQLLEEQDEDLTNSVIRSLPGDGYRDFAVNSIHRIRAASSCKIYQIPEYRTVVTYQGQRYEKYAFPFGTLQVRGDLIPNPESTASAREKLQRACRETIQSKRNALETLIQEQNRSIEPSVAKATKGLSLLSIALLVISILISLFLRSTPCVLAAFSVSLVVYILSSIHVRNTRKRVNSQVNALIQNETERTELAIEEEGCRFEEEILRFEETYRQNQLSLLNQKLSSLGLQAASSDDLDR